jgi:LytS/YehU family sensor histidine kinase
MRKTLINSQYTSIPIKEELEALELYLELESLRFKEKFDWTIRVDEEIDTLLYKIPTLLIQPYVENSICHGLMHKDNGKGNIRIDLLLESDHIRCMVDDNGIGREKALEIKNNKNREHHSLGTSITESRLKLISSVYGKRMNIHYTDKMDEEGQPAGTRVEISIPIIT